MCVSSPAWQLIGLMDRVGDVLTRVEVPWVKMFQKSCFFSEMFYVPLLHIPKPFYETIVHWIKAYDIGLFGALVFWASDLLLEHLAAIQRGGEGQKTNRSKDAVFIVLAIVLRWKPYALIVALPSPRRDLGQEKIPVIVWMIAQASQGDLAVGLYLWVQNLLPVAASEVCSPESRDHASREQRYSGGRANGSTIFPASRLKATERLEEIYRLLKEVALPVCECEEEIRQIFTLSLKLLGEGNSSNPVLAKEATSIGIWCLGESFVDCCNHWDNLYKENLEASIALLKLLVDKWKDHSLKLSSSPSDTLNRTMKSFRLKNKKGITQEDNASLYKEADKSCKIILSRGSGKLAFTAVVLATTAALVLMIILFKL